jgi:hypothetical protein
MNEMDCECSAVRFIGRGDENSSAVFDEYRLSLKLENSKRVDGLEFDACSQFSAWLQLNLNDLQALGL